MSNEFERVDAQYKELLQEDLSKCPVKVGAIASKLGIQIKVVDMGLDMAGQISYEYGLCVIRVNRNDVRERQRFTIAHEIAHFLLHHDIIKNSDEGIKDRIKDRVLYRSGALEEIEYEANRLAADLLMPPDILKRELDAIGHDLDALKKELGEKFSHELYSDIKVEKLASCFQVSKDVVRIRLKNMK